MSIRHPAVAAYERAYATVDPAQARQLVAEAFTEDGVLESPYLDAPVTGREALAAHIAKTREMLVGTTSTHTSSIERVGDTLRWTWAFHAGEQLLSEGMDIAVLRSEKIARLVVFDGPLPSLRDDEMLDTHHDRAG
jgi:hypothetical protein